MWEYLGGVTNWRPFMTRRRNNPIAYVPALLIGASVGIAAWEMTRRGVATALLPSTTEG